MSTKGCHECSGTGQGEGPLDLEESVAAELEKDVVTDAENNWYRCCCVCGGSGIQECS